jgi:hypothetical protein
MKYDGMSSQTEDYPMLYPSPNLKIKLKHPLQIGLVFAKAMRVIESCTTRQHLDVALYYIDAIRDYYKPPMNSFEMSLVAALYRKHIRKWSEVITKSE